LAVMTVIVSFLSCSKNSSPSGPGNSNTALWPLKAGDTWVYADSVFTDSLYATSYPDTITALSTTYNDPGGFPLFEITSSSGQGWFYNNSWVGVDPSNSTIYLMDTLGSGSYPFFFYPPYDNSLVGSGTDFSNPTCPVTLSQYGFLSTVTVNGFSCVRNIMYAIDCNNITQEVVVIYVSPGNGVVRIEDYELSSKNTLQPTYTQTLQSVKLAQ
ncbi:MAG: hypothetical protein ABUL46_03360, partial [Chitinophaga rupis]